MNNPILLQPAPNLPPTITQKMSILVPLLNSPTNLSNVRDFSNVCRTCATITEFVMPIFSGEGLQNNLADKIKRHLPIQVQENDELPLVVCYQCSSTLLAWHELVKCSIQADAALRAKISSQRKTNPPNVTVKSSSSVQEEAQSKSKPEFSRPQPQQYRTCVYCASTHPVASYRKHLVIEHSHRLFHCEECDSLVDRKDFIVHMSFHALHLTAKGITRKKFKSKEDIVKHIPRRIPSTVHRACAPQCPPKTQSPQCAPNTENSQCLPITQSPQYTPKTENPQASPKTIIPQYALKTENPQASPKTLIPQFAPKIENPQASPKTLIPQFAPKIENPQASPKTLIPQFAPKIENPQASPKTLIPQFAPKIENPQASPKTLIPQFAPKIENPQASPKTLIPQFAPKIENPQASPKTLIPQFAPKIENPQCSPITQSSQCVLKTECPQYAPKIESKPIIETKDINPLVVVKTKTSVQENEFSDHSDMDGFEPLPESVFEAIEDSQDGQHFADNITHTPENQPHSDECKIYSQPENNHLSIPAPSLKKIYKFNNCSVVIKPININNCAQMNIAIKNSKVNNNPALPANKTLPKTTDASTSGNHPTDKKEKRKQNIRKCPFCPKECRAASSYFYHLKYFHKESKEHECEVCGRKFNTRSCLTQHMAIHAAQYEFECQQCQKRFKTKASLYIHEQTHSGKKSWSCSQCETSFRWKTQLQRHMKRHAAEKGHVCDICGRGFSVRSDLLRHTRTHTAGNFNCDKCGQKFAQLRYLKVHTTKQHSTNVRKGSK